MRKNGKKEGKKRAQHRRPESRGMQDEKNTFQFLQYNFAASLSWLEFFFFEGSSDGVAFVQSENSPIGLASECEKALVWCKKVIAEK